MKNILKILSIITLFYITSSLAYTQDIVGDYHIDFDVLLPELPESTQNHYNGLDEAGQTALRENFESRIFSFKVGGIFETQALTGESQTGTWSLNANELTTQITGEEPIIYNIISQSHTTLYIKPLGENTMLLPFVKN